MKKKAKKEIYPQVLYVVREEDGKDFYFLADENYAVYEDGEVAVYELTGTKTKKTTIVLE